MAPPKPSAAAGPVRGSIRQRYWAQLSRGLYIPRASANVLSEALRGWELVLPDSAAFTSLTAAELRGWWLPKPISHPVFVAVPIGARYPERKGLLVHRHPRPVPTATFNGFRLTTGAETLLAAARDLGLLDLVILGDSALRSGDCTLEELQATAGQQRRGAPRLRGVLPLLDKRSESPWESVMRVLHEAAGIHVEPQKEIFDQWAPLSRGLTCGWSVLDAFTSTTVISIVTDRHIAAILAGTVDLSKSTGNGWVSPPTSCSMKVLRSSPARTGCSDDPGIPDALRVGRRC
jgi:hypothetical protein